MERLFLAKVKDDEDRDVVKYIEVESFVCDHYFSGVHLTGACFSGYEEEFKDLIKNDFEKLETILTKDELLKIFELNDKLDNLGYGITRGSEKYNKGLEILNEINKIVEKLKTDENKKLFEKVIADEKEYVKNEHYLTDEEVNEIFENYKLEYQDRAIIGSVWGDFNEMVDDEKYSFGYEDFPYFDDEKFGKDLLASENYLELSSGEIVMYNY